MVESAEREPTMEEIVVALRETQRCADQPPLAGRGPADALSPGGATDIGTLRDHEIERLRLENVRLNQRVIFLLKVIEREQARNAADPERSAVAREVRAALDAMLNLLEQQRTPPVAPQTRRPAAADGVPSDWIVELIRRLDAEGAPPQEPPGTAAVTPPPNLRRRMLRALHGLRP